MKNNQDEYHRRKVNRINNFLSNPRKANRNQHTIFPLKFIDFLQDQFDDINKKQIKFEHQFFSKQLSLINDSIDITTITRNMKLRFRCKNNKCSEYLRDVDEEEKDSQRRWTTYFGQIQLQFYFIQHRVNKKPYYILQYSFKLYKQKCKTCQEWGKGGIIESVCDKLLDLYREIIINSLQQFKTKKTITLQTFQKNGIQPLMMNQNTTSHMAHLCEACKLKKCVGFYHQRKISENCDTQE